MDWYPLYNSLRIALISTAIIFFAGIAAAYYVARLPRVLKGVLDVLFTLPLVLPPTVVGYLLLRVLGPKRTVGAWVLAHFNLKLTMVWWSAIFALSFSRSCTARRAVRSRALTKRLPTQAARSAARIPGFSGGYACPAAGRVSLRERCSRLRVRSVSTAQHPWWQATRLDAQRLFRRRSISCGAQMMTRWRSSGSWSTLSSQRWCCWRSICSKSGREECVRHGADR